MTTRATNDASRSSQGTIYQVYVALVKCFEMATGQSVVIERMGDVTIEGAAQIEVKQYSDDDPLTNSHPNFWNTLNNWVTNSPDENQCPALMLHTTQAFGARTALRNWNASDEKKRLSILEEIH